MGGDHVVAPLFSIAEKERAEAVGANGMSRPLNQRSGPGAHIHVEQTAGKECSVH